MPSTIDTTPGSSTANSYATRAEGDTYFGDRLGTSAWTGASTDDKDRSLIMATRMIGQLRLIGHRLYGEDEIVSQALEFPRVFPGRIHGSDFEALLLATEVVTGDVDSATSTTVVDAALDDQDRWQDDYWNNGSVLIYDGTGEAQIREVSDFVRSTRTLTVGTAWTTTPDATSRYKLIRELDTRIIHACLEQARFLLAGGDRGDLLDAIRMGVRSMADGAVSESYDRGEAVAICAAARNLLRPWISSSIPLARAS